MMAEKRDCEGTTEDEGDDIKRKRLDTNAFAGTSNDISDDTISQYDKDPLSDLTRNQRVVLYTLFLCFEDPDYIFLDDDDGTMGDIDVRKTLEGLEDRGLVIRVGEMFNSDRTVYTVDIEKLNEIIQSYIKNCLLSDIDKDFFIDVAGYSPLRVWYTTQAPIINRDILNPQAGRSITFMRLMMEGRMDDVECIKENCAAILNRIILL
ncbi:uncharacterized protein LOC134279221 isoform X2 [Saccostrea cucullata]|uniref:uncharacterized protein LOC134279221 isoform X2 n=1 Tax=Saccostrea cuccullata TaxID=36930 RepID=UPI002ED19B38